MVLVWAQLYCDFYIRRVRIIDFCDRPEQPLMIARDLTLNLIAEFEPISSIKRLARSRTVRHTEGRGESLLLS